MATRRLFDGALIEIGALPIVGSSSSNGNASGLFSTVTVSAYQIVNGTGNAVGFAVFGNVSVVNLSGSAAGSAFVNQTLATVQIAASVAIGTGNATTSGAAGSVSLAIQIGAASGGATGAGELATITMVGMEATVEVTSFIRASVVVSDSAIYSCAVSDSLILATCSVSSRVLFSCNVSDDLIGNFSSSERLLFDTTVYVGVL